MSPKKNELRHADDHAHEPEGCLCDFEYEAGSEMSDSDLPQAVGGVALMAAAAFNEAIDGCDVDFTKTITADADLPAAAGGGVV